MATHGARVLVVEREKQFHDRARSEAMMPWGVAEAQRLGIYGLLRGTCGHELHWWDIYLESERIVHRNLVANTPHHTPAFAFSHPAMQEVLLGAAAAAGAEVRRQATAREVRPGTLPTVVIAQDDHLTEVRARLVVGADGRASMVRSWAGFRVHQDPEHLLIGGVLLEHMAVPEDTIPFVIHPGLGQLAYLFPEGGGRVRAYVVCQKTGHQPFAGDADLPRFIAESVQAGARAEWYAEARAAGPLVTFDGPDIWVKHPYRGGVVLIGDAATASNPTWGEGLSLAVRDARVLRDHLLHHDDWTAAGHAYAEAHDRAHNVIHTIDTWFTELLLTRGPDADARRARALPLLVRERSRIPDLVGLGPDLLVDEMARRRFFGEV
jgi:2-polyprenyl-6-methoxyphenol hydroxylase-like FAD-dependent oxidoreductase